jgi:hypothetical protein
VAAFWLQKGGVWRGGVRQVGSQATQILKTCFSKNNELETNTLYSCNIMKRITLCLTALFMSLTIVYDSDGYPTEMSISFPSFPQDNIKFIFAYY